MTEARLMLCDLKQQPLEIGGVLYRVSFFDCRSKSGYYTHPVLNFLLRDGGGFASS